MVGVLDFVFPQRCVGCKKLGRYLCLSCQKNIKLRAPLCPICDRPAIDGITHPACLKPFSLNGLTTIFRNIVLMKKAIKQLKYRWVSDLAESLIDIIPPETFAHLPIDASWSICPIPLHPSRLKWRGFNQAEELAKSLSQRLNLDLVDGLLIRKSKRIPQADISDREERIKNVRGLFSLSPNILVAQYSHILLFDDIWTTGATMKEATKVLKRNGVRQVWGMTLAR